MALKGDVGSMGLEAVFGFLTVNALQGVLTVTSGRSSSFRIYFRDGRIFLPFSDHEGIESLGKMVTPDGVIARAWKGVVRELRKRSDRFRRISAETVESRRRRYEEEIHDLFLWDEARFEFRPGALPKAAEVELEAGRGLLLEPQAIVMEVARRADERDRVRRAIPTGRVVLVPRSGCDGVVAEALGELEVDVALAPFDGNRPLDEQLVSWGGSQFHVLGRIASLIETRQLVPLSGPETRARFKLLLEAKNLRVAAGLLGHVAEVDGPEAGLRLALELASSTAFRGLEDMSCTWTTDGPRAFSFVRELIEQGTPFTLAARHAGGERRIALLPGVLSVEVTGPSEVGELETFLVQLGHLKPGDVPPPDPARATRAGRGVGTRLAERIGRAAVDTAQLLQFIDQVAEVGLWRRTEVELRNRGAVRDAEASVVSIGSAPAIKRLREGLKAWSAVFTLVPSLDSLFVRGPKASSKDPAGRLFARFSAFRNLGELSRLAEAPPLVFARLTAQGLKAGYLRRPSPEALRRWVEQAKLLGNEAVAYRLVLAGLAFEHREEFSPLLAAYRGRELLPRAEPAFYGELSGVGLPSVLQTLNEHRRSGTLTVTAGTRRDQLFFYQGDAFLLQRSTDTEGDEFVNFLLGDGEVSDLLRSASVPEHQLEASEVRQAKDRFLDVIFWEDAVFSFSQNDLPDEFFQQPPGTTKVALQTSRFLLEAVQAMTRWDAIRRQLRSARSVLEFVTPGAKLEAARAGECVSTLTLVDGRLSFEELLRLSGEPRQHVGEVVAKLIESGALRVRD